MAILIKKNGNLVSVGESSKVEVVIVKDDFLKYASDVDNNFQLWELTLEDLTYITKNQLFYGQNYIKKVSLPNCSACINNWNLAFSSCSNLEEVNLPKATDINDGAFASCPKLKIVNLPLAYKIGGSCFFGCSSLETISLPSWTTMNGSNIFNNCSKLHSIICNLNQINWSFGTFGQSATESLSITLLKTSVCSLSNTSYLPASSTRHINIYVPANLISSYQTATNWATLYNNGYIDFQAIS